MKRNAVLIATDCKAARFVSLANRGQMPFGDGTGTADWNDYSLRDCWRLRIMLDAPKGIDIDTARFIAKEATDTLGDLPFYHTEGVILYAGSMFVGGERVAVAGRLSDIAALADPVDGICAEEKRGGLVLLNATEAARAVMRALNELGLPQSDWLVPVPENVEHLPEWFQKIELERRELLFGNPDANKPEAAV